jgi:rhodanese-related sulfurtransferase
MSDAPRSPKKPPLAKLLLETGGIVLASVIIAAGVNAARAQGLPWVAAEDYEVLVPCPEPVGDAAELVATDERVRDRRSLVIDVREPEEYKQWHLPDSLNVPFDWLGPPPDDEVRVVAQRVAKSGAQRVVVYGDGGDPDSGREWARLLAGARIKNVFYVRGGAKALTPEQGGEP